MANWKKTDPFSARLPHQNIVPFPEADRREAEEKKSSISKGAKSTLKLVKFEMPKCQKTTAKWAFESYHSFGQPNLEELGGKLKICPSSKG